MEYMLSGARAVSYTHLGDKVIAFDEYKIGLENMEKDITELRDSL